MTRPARLLALLALVACEAPLDPIAPSDLAFSMSGYLDASADTHYVRVEPFGETRDIPPGPIDAEVVLVLPGGDVAPMTQEVRAFETGPAHLFWTTADVEPGQTYEVVARAASGDEARATVAVPDVVDLQISLTDGITSCPTAVFVGGAEFVVDIQSSYRLPGDDREYSFTKAESFAPSGPGVVRAAIFYGEDAAEMETSLLPHPSVVSEVFVAVGTDDWIAPADLTLEEALARSGLGRIEGGVGFVGGVVTYRIPFVPGVGRIPRPYSGEPIEPCLPNAAWP